MRWISLIAVAAVCSVVQADEASENPFRERLATLDTPAPATEEAFGEVADRMLLCAGLAYFVSDAATYFQLPAQSKLMNNVGNGWKIAGLLALAARDSGASEAQQTWADAMIEGHRYRFASEFDPANETQLTEAFDRDCAPYQELQNSLVEMSLEL